MSDRAGSRWTILRAAGQTESDGLEIPSLPVGTIAQGGQIRLAVGQNGEARLLLPLTSGERAGSIEGGAALQIGVTTLLHRGRAARFLDIVCNASELEHVFDELVDAILARLATNVGVMEAVSATITDFRALLTTPLGRDLDRSRVAGLVAELLILNRLLDYAASAWRAWRGPEGDRHDFRVGDRSLEVKASLRAGATEITVNGLRQLEPPDGGTLHLAHFSFEPVDGGLLTVAGLGSQALARASEPEGLLELLSAIGCADVRAAEWNKHAFRLESERFYQVSSGFPRISPSCFVDGRIPGGVVDATYRLDLAFATAFECPATHVDIILQGMAT